MGFSNPLTDNWVVSSLLTGMRRVFGVPVQSRLPITVQLLMRIRTRLNLNSSRHASFWAICLTAFLGYLGNVICYRCLDLNLILCNNSPDLILFHLLKGTLYNYPASSANCHNTFTFGPPLAFVSSHGYSTCLLADRWRCLW